jgi:hypothetical protein
MRVRFLVDIASFDFGYHKGQVADVEDDAGRAWVASGIAEAAAIEPLPVETAMRVGAPERAVQPRRKGRR